MSESTWTSELWVPKVPSCSKDVTSVMPEPSFAYTSLIGANPMEQIISKNVRNLILEIFKLFDFQK